MENLNDYAPIVIYVITTLIGLKVFARREEILALETRLLLYINEHFTKVENHNDLKEQISELRKDVTDIKNLLIENIRECTIRNGKKD